MARFRFSRRAEADLLGTVAYTLRTWGENQAVGYRGLARLSHTPRLGACE